MLKTFFFPRKFVSKIDRKLPEKDVKNLKKTSLKLFPSTPKLQKYDKSENRHKSFQKPSKNLPEAFPEYPEIANKPARQELCVGPGSHSKKDK